MILYDKNGIIVRKSVQEDVEYLSNNLRQSDVDEIWSSHHHLPRAALQISLMESAPCLTVDDNGTPVAMFGITAGSLLGSQAIIWFLASEDINNIRIRFLRNCKIFIEIMLNEYPMLYNFCDARNTESIKWLKYLGAKIQGPVDFGVENMPFYFFSFEREC